MKKLISAILVFVLLVSVIVPAASAVEPEDKYPVILLTGDGASIYDAEGNEIYPYNFTGDSGDGSNIVDAAKNILIPFLKEGILFDKWDNYYDAVEKEVAELTAAPMLDKNGEASDGSGISKGLVQSNKDSAKVDKNPYSSNMYHFWYDWRTDPWSVADDLNNYINEVMKTTGKDKVVIIGKCLGSCFVSAYIAKYGNEHIKGLGFDGAVAYGNKYFSDIFSGRVVINGAAIERFIGDKLDVSEIVTDSLDLLVKSGFIDAVGNTVYKKLYDKLSAELVKRITTLTYATFPGWWTMVLPEDYEIAKKAVFGEEGSEKRAEYAGLIEKIDNYHENVRLKLPEILNGVKDNGANLIIIAKYGVQGAPVTPSSDLPSDDDVTVDTAAFGAVISESISMPFPESYIAQQKAKGLEKYISPDKQVDASTCLFPDYTWFTKGIEHADWTDEETALLVKVITADTQLTVDDNVLGWSRYMMKTGGKLVPMTEENCYSGDYSTSKKIEKTDFMGRIFAFVKSLAVNVRLWFKLLSQAIEEKKL